MIDLLLVQWKKNTRDVFYKQTEKTQSKNYDLVYVVMPIIIKWIIFVQRSNTVTQTHAGMSCYEEVGDVQKDGFTINNNPSYSVPVPH